MTLVTPNSGGQAEKIAPMLTQASISTRASGTLGTYAATRSPRLTPSDSNPARARPTWSRSCAAVSVLSARVSERAMTTTSSAARPGSRSTASA